MRKWSEKDENKEKGKVGREVRALSYASAQHAVVLLVDVCGAADLRLCMCVCACMCVC